MTDIKKLMDDATPRPWGYEGSSNRPGEPPAFYEIAPQRDDESGERELDWKAEVAATADDKEADAALIVYAVNHLPDYEAALDALADLLDLVDWHAGDYADADAMRAAREALGRLREQAPVPA